MHGPDTIRLLAHRHTRTLNRACSEAMLRGADFEIAERPEAEIYLCRTAPVPHEP